jgi:hypothetical protein
VTVAVTWGASGVVNAGSGTAHLWALITSGAETSLSYPGTVVPCGIDLPPFSSALSGGTSYGAVFPNSLFDGTTGTNLPSVSGAVMVSNNGDTATFTSAATTNLIGIGTTPMAWTAWPSLATAEADQIDMDNDGHWGVTANAKTGTGFANIPIPVDFATKSADQLFMTLRSVMSLNGSLSGNCTSASGPANVTAMDNHIIGCHIAGAGTDAGADFCTTTSGNPLVDSETSSLDKNSPVLAPGTATFSAVKLTTTGTCPNVRAALP